MGVDLSNLHLTLDQFNAAASGKYNIGQLKLSKDGTSVYRTNNHKTWTIFNNTPISPEESFALKTTFCQALAREGLSQADIASVKEKLGIAGKAPDVMKAGTMQPLSAADVRQIIDEYAGQINQKRSVGGVETLKTSEEIYEGVGEQTLKSREMVRNQVNSQTVDSMVTEMDHSVNTMLDILQYTGEGETETINNIQKGIAREISNFLKQPGNLPGKSNPTELKTAFASIHEADNATIVLTFKLDGGNSFSVDTGLERAELLAQMDKVLAPKAGGAGKPEGTDSKISEPKVKNGQVKTKGADKVNDQQPTLSAGQNKIIKDLEDALTLLDPNDKSSFNKQVEKEKQNLIDKHLKKIEATRKKLESGPNPENIRVKTAEEVLADEKFQKLMEAKAKDEVRSGIIKEIAGSIQVELDKARGLDHRNVALVNKVRDALSGDTSIDRKELIDEIKLAFTTKVVSSADKVMEELEKGIEDDLDENLNINAWLGQ